MAEALTEYMSENNIKVRYIHSDVDTLERIQIIHDLRKGIFDVLIGINLLREGLDIPECSLVGILDADKEGYLRSKTSLIQTIGRAARNIDGKVILYADEKTNSIKFALEETERRRKKQESWNTKNGIIPKTIKKRISEIIERENENETSDDLTILNPKDVKNVITELEKQMKISASNLDFEKAAEFRDKIKKLEQNNLDII